MNKDRRRDEITKHLTPMKHKLLRIKMLLRTKVFFFLNFLKDSP